MRKYLVLLIAAAFVSGCETPKVSQEEMDSVNYGPAPVHWKEEILGWLKLRLRDPKDAIVEFRAGPQQLYNRGTPVRGEQYGWGVCVWVNDKNKSGAYDGFYPMTFVLRNEKIVAVNGGPDDANIIGARYAREQCERLGAPFKQ